MGDLRVSFPEPCDEKWEAMAPAGCARVCARCDKVIHDLSNFELGEAETLLRGEPDACVRARIGADGAVELKPARRGGARRMVIAAAASAGLLTAGAPALARADRPDGAIAGKVGYVAVPIRVTATDAGGRKYRAKVKADGRFKIKGVPAGTYTLTFIPDCGENWTVANVVVATGETVVPDAGDEAGCIVIGMLRIEDVSG